MTGEIDRRPSYLAFLARNCRSSCMDPTFTSIIRTALNTGLTKAKIEKIIAKSEQIEQKLLELNLRLVHSIALQHQGMGLELDDLVYEGKSL
jgi:DNA-directed RNA polymerase sigma subunit (sigma70/sigma32)